MRTRFVSSFLILTATASAVQAESVDFARDVQPVLARSCFACHGPDEAERKAKLRLDRRDVALERGAIVPGKPEESELVRRIFASDPDDRMPPPDAPTEPLDEAEMELLRRWISAGAEYEPHWAFVPPRRPSLPSVERREWLRNGIDAFVLARLERDGLEPAPPADRHALVRRVYLDLIGLPPTPQEADAFVADREPGAYERVVDRLLSSPRYGERWARRWLDLARYADTNGYEKDRPRSIWPYRDWVIDALNAGMPYDQFTVEQLAGDMLPGATLKQRIATGFHRNTMLNEEGGIDPLEYRFYAMVDRVATTGVVWLGLTTGCARCHSHKYDPISHTEHYELMALLNNADEVDQRVPTPRALERREAITSRIRELEAQLEEQFPPAAGDGPVAERRRQNFEKHLVGWIAGEAEKATDWKVLRPRSLESNLPRLEVLADGSIFSTGDITKRDVFRLVLDTSELDTPITALRLEALPDERLPAGGPGRAYYEGRKGDFFLSEVTASANGRPIRFADASHSYGKISIGSGDAKARNVIDGEGSTGWSTAGREGEAHQLVLVLDEPLAPSAGDLELKLLFERHFAASLGRFRLAATSDPGEPRASSLPVEIEALLARDATEHSAADRRRLREHFLRVTPFLAEARKPIEALRRQLPELPTTLVFQERPEDHPRATQRHHRGEFLQAREEVDPGIPAVFTSAGDGSQAGPKEPRNRLELARWLVSGKNPLGARVTVNRAWRAFFGHGLVRTSGDFGTQSQPPSHPELLDWLATELVERRWSLKSLHRLIVTSATYRQSSRVRPDLLKRDPQNRLLARAPRLRLEAELVRDHMLAASGLLSSKMGGPSVYPPQPASVTALAYGNTAWPVSEGQDRYRRSLYTFSKRTAPFAAYAVYDAPTGESCVSRRDRSNTPLQALTLLNDGMFVEMAQALARRALQETGADSGPRETASWIFRQLLTRPPCDDELAEVMAFWRKQVERLERGELDAGKVAAASSGQPPAREAAWTLVARVLMNLDEAITRP